AAFAQNAPLRVVSDYRRKKFLRLYVLILGKPLFDIAPVKYDLLQLTFTAAVAYRAIKRVIRKQEFAHRTLCLFDLRADRRHDYDVRDLDRARGRQLRHLFNANHARSARGLSVRILVIAEGRDALAVVPAHIYQDSAFFSFDLFAVDRNFYEFC